MERHIGDDGQFYMTAENMKKANRKFAKFCAAPITAENIMEKAEVLRDAAEEMSCDEYYGDDDRIYALATQLNKFFGGDMEKAKDFFKNSTMRDYWDDVVWAIEWLKRD